MLRGEDIVCFSTADWDTPLPTNKHHLMTGLARQNRVLYVETLGTRAPRMQTSDLKRLWRRVRRGVLPPQQPAPNIFLLSPLVIPLFRTRSVVRLNVAFFRQRLKRALRRLGMLKPIFWIYNPYAIHFLKDLPRKVLVYHCVDDLSMVPGAERSGLRQAEIAVLKESDLVFASAKILLEHCRTYNENTIYQPNVADFDHFNQAAHETSPVAEDMRSLSKPIILFSGNLAPHKVDFALLEFLAARNPDWTVALIGPLWEGLPRRRPAGLKALRNVWFLGYVPYERLPRYLKAADVLIIPYLVNDVTRNVFPIKFFEYLATGKPVVATALPSLADYREHAPLCTTYEDFETAVREALHADTGAQQQHRIALACQNTWEQRLEEMSEAILRKIS